MPIEKSRDEFFISEKCLYKYVRSPFLLTYTVYLRWLKTVIFPCDAWALARISARSITRTPEGSRDESARFRAWRKSKQTWRREAYFVKHLSFRKIQRKNIILNRCAGTWTKLLFKFSSYFLLGQAHLGVSWMKLFFYSLCRKTLFTGFTDLLRALLISGPPSLARKGWSCKAEILISA